MIKRLEKVFFLTYNSFMVHQILADYTTSISEMKANPLRALEGAGGAPVAVLNHNKPAFYCLMPEQYEELMEALEDAYLMQLALQRKDEPEVFIDLDAELGKK